MSRRTTMLEKAKTSNEHPKHVSMRASLHRAFGEDEELKALAHPESWEDTREALDKLEAMADSARPLSAFGVYWDHGNA